MNRTRTLVIAACALAGIAQGGVAAAADRAQGWANWVDRTQWIDEAMNGDQMFKLKAACEGVFGTISRQGFAFPRWAMEIVPLCQSMITWEASRNSVAEIKRANGRWCGEIKGISAQLARAEPVPEESRAQPLALKLSRELAATYGQLCQKK